MAALNERWDALAEDARQRLAADGYGGDAGQIERHASLHYQGQTYELTVPVPDGPLDDATLAALEEAFHAEHERTYGHRAGSEEPVELVTMRVLGRGRRPAAPPPRIDHAAGAEQAPATRRAYFGPEHGWREAAVIGRAGLAERQEGPLIVEEYDATCVVPPGVSAALNAAGCIVLNVS